ncbi:MAG: 2-hydroxyglutaryl-CoA dehydratase [Desulfobacterales bacterium CG23_combo_of_CG06-09_8_20_14_all_51_8]|nr:MAG: 2-hydroxyglutaryl-CoA dehydratase [Desulfobacterales bacterium CG23_combo_of_CG06-09_8_20_14_all_51_8]
MNVFHDAATHVECESIHQWKKTGKPVVGYTCSYTPAEIFHAVDILPVRLRGIETEGMEIGDTYFGPFICSFPKCILQLAGKGKFSFLDGAIITPGCDGMRRLDECWRKAGEDFKGIVPDYFYYFDVPHKAENHGMAWYLDEIRALIKSIEDHFHVNVTDEKLTAAIREFNKGRRLLGEIETLRSQDNVVVSGTDVFAATVAGTVMPREEYTRLLEDWLAELKTRTQALNTGESRVMLVGSISDEIDLFKLIEDTDKAIIVGENLCFGIRYEGNEIREDGDPIEALAQHYLGSSVCPRMYGKYKERLAMLKEKIHQSRAEGVIMQNIRFCDLHGAENALFERDLEAMGIPCLRVEREYGPHIDAGRMKLRINAFLERMDAARRQL